MKPVRFRVAALDPRAHLFEVTCSIEAPGPGQVFRMPSWIRGSYLVRDFAKHVIGLRADRRGNALPIVRLDKRSFRVNDAGGAPMRLQYRVYAFDSSVRKAYLDERRGFFNGSSLFYCPDGFEAGSFEVEILRPDPELCRGWKLATTLKRKKADADGFGKYLADSYETLIDNPVEMAAFQRVDFEVDGIPHALVLSGRCEVDSPRLAADLAKVCHVQRELFGQQPKLNEYLFLTQVTGNGYGGLEHRSCTALVAARDALPRPGQSGLRKGYLGFLGLVSHEYFHLWNVKRITAASFAASDLAEAAYSQDLWAYEGVTSYYDDLMLLRAGLVDAAAYLDLVAETATRLQRAAGRGVQTLADASFEAWIKYYQPDENTPNQTVSYYLKGALAALCLDLRLRRDSKVTLDDVMRALWKRYGSQDIGVPEGGLEQLAAELSGLDLGSFFDSMLRSTDELPFSELLSQFGVKALARAAAGPSDEGGRTESKSAPTAALGIQLRGDLTIASVHVEGAASRAGLSWGDALLALDGLRVTAGNWPKMLDALVPGRVVSVHYFRGDELLTAQLKPQAVAMDTWTLTLDGEASAEALQRRLAWLGA